MTNTSGLLRRGVAVLALQGDFEAHRRALADAGVESFEAKRPADLAGAEGLVIPGGESTTLWKFFEAEPWEEAFTAFAASGRPVLGTCAGAILLAKGVVKPRQDSFAEFIGGGGTCGRVNGMRHQPERRIEVLQGLRRQPSCRKEVD